MKDIADANEDSTCSRNAGYQLKQASRGQIERMQAKERNLQVQMSNANNNMVGATYMNRIRSQVAQIDTNIEFPIDSRRLSNPQRQKASLDKG